VGAEPDLRRGGRLPAVDGAHVNESDLQSREMRDAKPGSSIRYVVGLVSLVGSFVALAAGGVQMVSTLERGGYGTSGIDVAIAWLVAGGALLGIGISLVIWELSIRHNIRH
jgi:hypothetical protein